MIHRKILRQCGGDLEHAVKSRTTEQSSAEDIINLLEEVTTRTRISSKSVNLKTRLNTPWKDSVDKNPKENSNNIKYKSADIIRMVLVGLILKQGLIYLGKILTSKLRAGKIQTEQLNEAEISLHLTYSQENELSSLLYDHKEPFSSDKEPLGAIVGHDIDIILNIERLYPPLLRRPAYSESPKSREALEIHIQKLLDLVVIRKVGHNEEVEITKPVIVAWHSRKSRMVGDFRALNSYTVLDRCPIPKIQISLTQISQAVLITTMYALGVFHQNVVTPRARNYLRIVVHSGVYEYLRIPFGIKNAPSHFQRLMYEIFLEELSEGWLIIYIDDIIVCCKPWEEHMYRLSRILTTIQSVIMKISLKKCHFGFEELKALGHVVSGLSLGIDKDKVAAVLLKPMPQNKKEIQSFLGFEGYYRQHIKDFASIARPLSKLCVRCGYETLIKS
ncbi:hypothetical protein O181_077063 [Austropuccinia psidii MF-1]|uniref:Reverse transcriptase domain-containing protein n=1 Tax=Austropuccinia psidii MF-1 TaxID=1389203 RepID=A0A9Q3FC22_9BASI|nr:hypothetical protein [Austropuccinia psidii MF-1]